MGDDRSWHVVDLNELFKSDPVPAGWVKTNREYIVESGEYTVYADVPRLFIFDIKIGGKRELYAYIHESLIE